MTAPLAFPSPCVVLIRNAIGLPAQENRAVAVNKAIVIAIIRDMPVIGVFFHGQTVKSFS